jgi:hypothetical protein
MPDLIANMRIRRIIIHQVFERSENRDLVEPRYNSELTALEADGLQTLQNRITNALGNDSYSVEMDINNTQYGSCFDVISSMIDLDEQGFINKSKNIALMLAHAQVNKKVPGGIVVVFSGLIGPNSNKFIGIIKAEIHNGFSILDRDNSLVLQYLSDLLLTPQQKLYKIGIFIEITPPTTEKRQAEDFRVLVYDHNLRTGNINDAAAYFYGGFLGCSLSSNSKKLTSDFYTYSKDYIDISSLADDKKLDLNYALYTYLKINQTNTISTADFSDQYLPELKDNYQQYMEGKNFPANSITKDLSYLKNKLQKRRIRFSSNVKLEAPSDNFNELVEIIGTEDGNTLIKIKGIIREQG